MERLWSPWRMEYIEAAHDDAAGCIFCELPNEDRDDKNFILAREGRAFALLNAFPYNPGHLMVAPFRHVGEFGELDVDEAAEIHQLAAQGLAALSAVYEPQGYNLGWNLGRIAGAGIVDHVHQHVVPRWAGDTNFMPVLADVKVLPEHLAETRERLADTWPE